MAKKLYDEFDIAVAHDDYIDEMDKLESKKNLGKRPSESLFTKTKHFTMANFNVVINRTSNFNETNLNRIVRWNDVFALISARHHRCAICFEDVRAPVVTPCGHVICAMCFFECMNYTGKCPECNTDICEEDCRPLYNVDLDHVSAEMVETDSYLTFRKFHRSRDSSLPLIGADPKTFNSQFSYLPLTGPSPFTSSIWILDNKFEYYAKSMINNSINTLFTDLDDAQTYMASVMSSIEHCASDYFEQELKTAEVQLSSIEKAVQMFLELQDGIANQMSIVLSDEAEYALDVQSSADISNNDVFYMCPIPGSYIFMSNESFSALRQTGNLPETIEARVCCVDEIKQKWEYGRYKNLLKHVPDTAEVAIVTVDVNEYI